MQANLPKLEILENHKICLTVHTVQIFEEIEENGCEAVRGMQCLQLAENALYIGQIAERDVLGKNNEKGNVRFPKLNVAGSIPVSRSKISGLRRSEET